MNKYLNWRTAKDFFFGIVATCGGIWVFVEPLYMFGLLSDVSLSKYALFLTGSFIGGVYFAWPTKRIEVGIPGLGSSFEVLFGDIFDDKGVNGGNVIVIPVNEYFDGKLNGHVSRNSLHGKFIVNVLDRNSQEFFRLTKQALGQIPPKQKNVIRSSGQHNKYAIGTVAQVKIGKRCFLLAVAAHTNLKTLEATATAQDLWTCLAGVWSAVRQYSNGNPVRIPLIGAGLAGIGLSPANLLKIVMISFLYHTRERAIANKMTLVLPHSLEGKLDLKSIKNSWT